MQGDVYKKTVVFDLDGTLVDSLADIAIAANMGLKAIDIQEKTVQEVEASIGYGLRYTIEQLLPSDISDTLRLKAVSVGESYYETHPVVHTKPFEGIIDMLSELSYNSVRLAVLSNKDQVLVSSVVQKLFGAVPWGYVYGVVPQRDKKPSPDTLLHIANDHKDADAIERNDDAHHKSHEGCSNAPVVMVGDNNADLYTALNAHMPFIGAGWGYYSVDVAYGKASIANAPSSVVSWVKEYWRK